MATYVLLFDPTGRIHEEFQVPVDKRVYLVRGDQASEGTATVTDLLSLTNYTMPNGVTVCETAIATGTLVSLAFVSRSSEAITLVTVEVINPRGLEQHHVTSCHHLPMTMIGSERRS